MRSLKCYATLTAFLLVLSTALPIPETPAADTGLSTHGSTVASKLELQGETHENLKPRTKRADFSPANDRASLSPRNDLHDLQPQNPATTDAALTTTTPSKSTPTATKTSAAATPFATVTLNPLCGPTIEEEESCSDPPFRVRRDTPSSLVDRAVANFFTRRGTLGGAVASVADGDGVVRLIGQAYSRGVGGKGVRLGGDADGKGEGMARVGVSRGVERYGWDGTGGL